MFNSYTCPISNSSGLNPVSTISAVFDRLYIMRRQNIELPERAPSNRDGKVILYL